MPLWIDTPMALSSSMMTARLALVPAAAVPPDTYLRFLARNRTHIAAYMPDEVLALATVSDVTAFLQSLAGGWIDGQTLCFAGLDRTDREPVAQVYVQLLDEPAGIVEIGYFSDVDCGRQGLASEAVEGVVSFLFERTNTHKVCLVCDEGHQRSRAVAHRTGFLLEGILREHSLNKDGTRPNRCFYGRLRNDPPLASH